MPFNKQHFSVDVEADGPVPGLYNMISFGIVPLHDLEAGFYGEIYPDILNAGIPEARNISGISYEKQLTFSPASIIIPQAISFIHQNCQSERAIFWSDNNGFDWSFWNYYVVKYGGGLNPFGFSSRRIGDLYAGLKGNPRSTQGWKKYRKTNHTHNALDDSRGNAEALRRIFDDI